MIEKLLEIVAEIVIENLEKKYKKTKKLNGEQNNKTIKRKYLGKIYADLITIIQQYPEEAPCDVLQGVDFGPRYSLENFDIISKSLEYQIQDYLQSLKREYADKNDINEQINNRNYAKNKLAIIQRNYNKSKLEFDEFMQKNISMLDLYAGRQVLNNLEEFKVVIYNVFISGFSVYHEQDISLGNTIKIVKMNLINSMRNDFGIA